MNRIIEILLATFGLILLSPIIFITALLIRIKLGKGVFFKQKRPGLHGKPFVLYKFRTMTDERDKRGNLLPDHIRLVPFGKTLRKYSLDELPQLINVLKGELSLVGPRPLLMEYLPLYSPFQMRRHTVKPGITGWAQVNGRNALSWEEKFELDVWYVENQTFLLDCKILALTVKRIIRPNGINHLGHETMPEFTGDLRAKSENS